MKPDESNADISKRSAALAASCRASQEVPGSAAAGAAALQAEVAALKARVAELEAAAAAK